jgi:hypothetical protein
MHCLYVASGFPDSAGYTALMWQGHTFQRKMKIPNDRELCLFNKRTQKAYVADAEMIIVKK